MVVSVVKADEPPEVDAMELIVDEAFDICFNLWAYWQSYFLH